MDHRNLKRPAFSDLLRGRMRQTGLGIRPLAKLIGMDVRSLRRIRNGQRIPELPTALRIANAVGIEPWQVFSALSGGLFSCH